MVGMSAATQFFSALFLMLLPSLYFAKRVGNVFITQSIATVVMFLLADALIPRFGIPGAGAVTMLGFAVLVVVQWIALRAVPVLRIRYDYARAGWLLAVFLIVSTLSFSIDFSIPAMGLAWAGTAATALVVSLWICPLSDVLRAWKGPA
jgi:uncharacterized membrane protein